MSFSTREIFEIAVRIERNGVRFYERAAELAGDAERRAMLERLAAMERDHREQFEGLAAALGGPPDEEDVFGLDRELIQCVRAMADGHVFDVGVDPASILTGDESAEEILSTAIGLEKESIVYYSALSETVDDPDTQQKLKAIIREEMGHIAELSEQRAALK